MSASDYELKRVEKRIKEVYSQASKEAKKRADDYFLNFKKDDEIKKKALKDKKITKKQYVNWKRKTLKQSKVYDALADEIANEFTNASKIAMDIVNGSMSKVYANSYNFGAYELEKGVRANLGFTIYDRNSIKAIEDFADLLPKAKPNIPKEKRWNKIHINTAVEQGIIQGDSMEVISKRLSSVAKMGENAAIRNARTMTISATNLGRLETYNELSKAGITVRKQWVATLDGKTRHSHRQLDGEIKSLDEKFSNGCRYPCDPYGKAEEIYNCRCTIVGKLVDFDDFPDKFERNNKLGKMTYDEWKKEKLTKE